MRFSDTHGNDLPFPAFSSSPIKVVILPKFYTLAYYLYSRERYLTLGNDLSVFGAFYKNRIKKIRRNAN